MSGIDLDRLAALAEAATPGRRQKYNDGVVGFPDAGIGKGLRPAAGSETDYDQRVHDAAFIAACDPATVTALIQRLREAEAAVHSTDYVETVSQQRDAAEARVAELEAELAKVDEWRRCEKSQRIDECHERDAAEAERDRLRAGITALAENRISGWRELQYELRALLAPTPTNDTEGNDQ